jgi:hypothetical protein
VAPVIVEAMGDPSPVKSVSIIGDSVWVKLQDGTQYEDFSPELEQVSPTRGALISGVWHPYENGRASRRVSGAEAKSPALVKAPMPLMREL